MMIRSLIAAALLGAAPAYAADTPAASSETSIPRMSRFLEWVADGDRGLFIRADTGRWYYARLQNACPRIATRPAMRFDASPSDRFDRFSAIRTDGWRCQVSSVIESEGPPPAHR
jgi:hypothetical protein